MDLGAVAGASTTDLSLAHMVPAAKSPGCSGKGADTDYIKTVTVESARLNKFWGELAP